jgi:hypothetical protein
LYPFCCVIIIHQTRKFTTGKVLYFVEQIERKLVKKKRTG